MEDKQSIISNIRANQPPLKRLPPIPHFASGRKDLLAKFTSILDQVSVFWSVLDQKTELENVIKNRYPDVNTICTNLGGISAHIVMENGLDPKKLQNVDLTILNGEFGVAENGAIWVSETDMVVRASAFITQHLVLVLPKENLVENMHQAYERIDLTQVPYGVFIAGPSKTGDIEQVLVTGAQGPRSMMVVMM